MDLKTRLVTLWHIDWNKCN